MIEEIIIGITVTVIGGLILYALMSKIGLSVNIPRLNISGSCLVKIIVLGVAILVCAMFVPSEIFSLEGLAAIIIIAAALLILEIRS